LEHPGRPGTSRVTMVGRRIVVAVRLVRRHVGKDAVRAAAGD